MYPQTQFSQAELRAMFANVPPPPDRGLVNEPVASTAPSSSVGPPSVRAIGIGPSSAPTGSPDPGSIAEALKAIRPQGLVQLVSIRPEGNNDITARTFLMPGELDSAVAWAVGDTLPQCPAKLPAGSSLIIINRRPFSCARATRPPETANSGARIHRRRYLFATNKSRVTASS